MFTLTPGIPAFQDGRPLSPAPGRRRETLRRALPRAPSKHRTLDWTRVCEGITSRSQRSGFRFTLEEQMHQRLSRPSHLIGALLVSAVFEIGCSANSPASAASGGSPTAPSFNPSGSPGHAAVGSQNGIELTAVVGSGSGIVNDTATANDGGYTLRGQVNINVHDAPPETLLYVQIAADVGLPGGQQTDGMCQRADAGAFAPLASYPGGPPATLQISRAGTGTVHTTAGINSPFLPDGARTDLVIRLIDALPPTSPTLELRTPCYVFHVK
jgi:hypothetical protein